jgi:hypothetical protein
MQIFLTSPVRFDGRSTSSRRLRPTGSTKWPSVLMLTRKRSARLRSYHVSRWMISRFDERICRVALKANLRGKVSNAQPAV